MDRCAWRPTHALYYAFREYAWYAVGYSMVILLAGLGVELGGLRRQLLERGEQISGISAIVLLTFGMIYLWTGFQDLQLQAQM